MKKIINDRFEAYELNWDTEYFGIPAAKAVLKDALQEKDRLMLIDFLNNFKFITINNQNNNTHNNYWLGKTPNAFLSDVNIQFTKKSNSSLKQISASVEVFESYPYDNAIIEMAKNSFIYSRFYNDPHLDKIKTKNIYLHWVESAFDKFGRYFAIHKTNEITTGFALFSIDRLSKSLTIELIAVNPDFRGNKIGHSLIECLENFCCKNDISNLKVGTQIDNISATIFYNLNGFVYSQCHSIYHYWPLG